MGLKRKRNLKVDVITKYSVFILSELDEEYLEDYIEARDTGMEADEEKEIQLQKIIQGSGGNIPLPVIAQIDNPARKLYGPAESKRHIRWSRDVPNECIEACSEIFQMNELFEGSGRPEAGTLPEDPEGSHGRSLEMVTLRTVKGSPQPDVAPILVKASSPMSTPLSTSSSKAAAVVQKRGVDSLVAVSSVSENMRDAFSMFGNSGSATRNKDDKLINYVLHRVILRYERAGYEAYTCFRRRVFHPTFKSKRNEAIMLEKLERMSAEFYALEELCSMLLEKTELEYRYLRQTTKLVETYHSTEMPRKLRRRYRRQILGVTETQAPSRMSFNVHAMMTNRDKIAYLRSIKPPTDLLLDVNYHNQIGPLLREAQENKAGQNGTAQDDESLRRKKTCRRCENRCESVFFTDDRKHNV